MSSLDQIYESRCIELMAEKANQRIISDYIHNCYASCKHLLGNMSIEEFAAYYGGSNPNKSRAGEKSQIEYLKLTKYPNILKLSDRGKNSITLYNEFGSIVFRKGIKSNLPGIKTFDARSNNDYFFLKATDLGSFTDSVGGGHQTNVKDEVVAFITQAVKLNPVYENKQVKIKIVIDGRYADKIISHCKPLLQNSPSITIGISDTI
jgi:hypothetical protein